MSTETKHPVDETVKSWLELDEMTDLESEQAWLEIEERRAGAVADRPMASPTGSRWLPPRRRVLAGVGVAAVAIVALSMALLPSGSDNDRQGFDLPRLEAASAAEVLAVAADGAREQDSLVPGAGQRLMFRAVETYKTRDEGSKVEAVDETIEEWIDASGKGERRTSGGVSSSSSSGSKSEFGKAIPGSMVTAFDVGSKPDYDIGIGANWRGLLSLSDLRSLPSDSAGALRSLRELIDGSVGKNVDYDRATESMFGRDLVVMITINNLLIQAPLDGGQRAALFDLVTTAPQWSRSEGSAPMKIENLGQAKTQDGRPGLKIRTSLDLAGPGAAMSGTEPGEWRLDQIVDPEAGLILETRESEGSGSLVYSAVTTKELKVIDR